MKKHLIAACLLALLAFLIPIEHKYDKWFRFYSLTLIPEGLNILPQYEKKIYFYISDLIALVLTAISLPLKRWWASPLWIVWLFALFSIIASPFAHYPIPYFRLLQLFTPIALVAFLSHTKEDYTRVILNSLCFAALFQAVLAIAQYVHQGPLGLRILGEPTAFSIFGTPGGTRWLFDRTANSDLLIRASGTLPHSNVLGGFLVFSILSTYFLLQKRKIWVLTLPLQIAALALSFSRSALFAWILATVVWAVFTKSKTVALLTCGSLMVVGTLLLPQYMHRGGVINYTGWAKGADGVRLVQQQTALRILKDRPLLGLGFSQFSERAGPYFPENTAPHIKATAPHNIFLFLACETGLISACALVAFIALLFWRFFKAPKTSESILFFSLLIAFLFIGCCDFYPLLFQQGKLMFFLTCGLLIANTRQNVIQKNPLMKEHVSKMFDAISPTYDRTNRIISLGMDQRWRKKVAQFLPPYKNLKILDLATGTGDQALALIQSQASIQSITGIDLAKEMLEIAKQKIPTKMQFLVADAEKLPFKEETFDATTFSFGIRNVSNPLKALQEIHRVLKPKGRCLILEFSMPPQPIRAFFLFYLRYVLPSLAQVISKNRTAYQYLNRTIEHFPSGKAFCQLMKEAQLSRLQMIPMNLGSVTLYVGEKV